MNHINNNKINDFYQKELDNSTDALDYLYVALSMMDNESFNDNEWVKDIILVAVEKSKNAEECSTVLDSIIIKDCFEDTAWTRKLFETALNQLNTATSLTSLAEYIIDAKYLGDKIWAKEVYSLAYQYAKEEMEYIMLAASVQKNLKDTVFSDEILQKAKNLSTSEENFQFLYEVFFDETDIGK